MGDHTIRYIPQGLQEARMLLADTQQTVQQVAASAQKVSMGLMQRFNVFMHATSLIVSQLARTQKDSAAALYAQIGIQVVQSQYTAIMTAAQAAAAFATGNIGTGLLLTSIVATMEMTLANMIGNRIAAEQLKNDNQAWQDYLSD